VVLEILIRKTAIVAPSSESSPSVVNEWLVHGCHCVVIQVLSKRPVGLHARMPYKGCQSPIGLDPAFEEANP
jgi:hypothetical protein